MMEWVGRRDSGTGLKPREGAPRSGRQGPDALDPPRRLLVIALFAGYLISAYLFLDKKALIIMNIILVWLYIK